MFWKNEADIENRKADKERLKTHIDTLLSRIEHLEDTVMHLSGEIGSLKGTFSKLNARITTEKRDKSSNSAEDKYKKMLSDLLGGEVVGVIDGDPNDRSTGNDPQRNG